MKGWTQDFKHARYGLDLATPQLIVWHDDREFETENARYAHGLPSDYPIVLHSKLGIKKNYSVLGPKKFDVTQSVDSFEKNVIWIIARDSYFDPPGETKMTLRRIIRAEVSELQNEEAIRLANMGLSGQETTTLEPEESYRATI